MAPWEVLLIFGKFFRRNEVPVDADLAARFVALQIRQTELYDAGKIKASNRTVDEFYRTCGRQIRALPDRGRSTLLQLIGHEHPEVRLTAAYLLLPLAERQAIRTLKAIASGRLWPTSGNAKTTLQEWRNGNLEVDWFLEG